MTYKHLNNRCYSTEGFISFEQSTGLSGQLSNRVKDIISDKYVEKFENLTAEQKYNIKSKYKNKGRDKTCEAIPNPVDANTQLKLLVLKSWLIWQPGRHCKAMPSLLVYG